MGDMFTKTPRGRTYLHIHIPKSAGSMFTSILTKNFRGQARNDIPLVSYLKYSREQMEAMLYLYPYKCFSSHNYCLSTCPFDSHDIKALSFVREPASKVVSSYFYLRNRNDMTSDWHLCKQMRLGELITHLQQQGNFHPFLLDGSQLEWMTGSLQEPENRLDMVKRETNAQHFYVFPTERFNEACVVLEHLFPEDFVDCSYTAKVNKSARDYVLTDGEKKKINDLPWIDEDKKLHQFANDFLDRTIKELFPIREDFAVALQEFNLRCDKSGTILQEKNAPKLIKWLRSVGNTCRDLLKRKA